MKELFSDLKADPITRPVLMIAISPRTGSTWLCSELAIATRAGRIMEIFNPRGHIQRHGYWKPGMNFKRYMAALAGRRVPAFIFKTAWMDFQHVATMAQDLFPDLRVAYLRRRNLNAQALSLYNAHMTGRWHSDGFGTERLPSTERSPSFDPDAARRMWRTIESELAGWEGFFAANGLKPLELYYEDFQADPRPAITALASLVGVDARPQFCRSPLRRLAAENDPLLHEIALVKGTNEMIRNG